MTLGTNTAASATYIIPTPIYMAASGQPASAMSPAVEAQVYDGVKMVGYRIRQPGVFTQGTANEGGIAQNDSNA